jgi:hypothetical protein
VFFLKYRIHVYSYQVISEISFGQKINSANVCVFLNIEFILQLLVISEISFGQKINV